MKIEARFEIDRGEFSLNVDFAIACDGVTAIFGPSGSGKTTLLRAIAGLEYSKGAYLKIGDQVWQDADVFVPPHKRSIGYVFQEASLFEHLNVQHNIAYGLKRLKGAAQKIPVTQIVELLEMQNLLARSPSQLSGGEQQRVAIARALAASPTLLLMDEPLAAVDERRKKDILPYLESVYQEFGIPVLYVTHSRNEVARLADYLLLLEEGKLVAKGEVSELFTNLDFPLSHDADAETVIEAKVAGHDEAFGLNQLDFPGGRFKVAGRPLPTGNSVRLQIMARDVSITLSHQQGTSILNIFPVTVEQLMSESKAQMTVRLMAGSVPLLSRVTRKSVEELNLKPGDSVFAQVKSVALLT